MNAIEDVVTPYPSLPFAFKFGTTLQEMNDCYDNVGRILSVILESKLNENFYNLMLTLKPIDNIDEYMFKFNFNRDMAIKHNGDLSLIIAFWLQDSAELRADSESALYSIAKVEEFVRFLEKQESEFKSSVKETIQLIKEAEKHAKDEDTTSSEQHHPSLTSPVDENDPNLQTSDENLQTINETPEFSSELKLIMIVNGESMSYTLAKASEEIKKAKDFAEKHLFATKSLRNCIEVLMAINQSNVLLIGRWTVGENALKAEKKFLKQENDTQSIASMESTETLPTDS